MSDYYTESQMQRIEQAAYDGAMLEAGKEWERQRGEFGATEAELQSRIAELEEECASLGVRLHDEMSQLEIATDLGNKRWVALNDLRQKCKRLEADYEISNRELLVKQVEITALRAELEAAQRWIPVSERLPDNWESVLTIDISKSTRGPVTAFYNPETSLWSTHFSCDLWVTHWMPLPELPKEREE